MPELDARGHSVPSVDVDDPSLQGWVLNPFLTLRDPIQVANTTVRAQTLVALAALPSPIVPSAAYPILFCRTDAPAGQEHEYTVDGVTFPVLLGTTWDWTDVTPAAGWGAPTAYQLPSFGIAGGFGKILGGRIELKSGTCVFNAGADVSIVPSLAIAPTRTVEVDGVYHNSGTVPGLTRVTLLATTGQILVRSSATFTMSYGTSAYVTIPPMEWPVTI
jgi:hypothetical protein